MAEKGFSFVTSLTFLPSKLPFTYCALANGSFLVFLKMLTHTWTEAVVGRDWDREQRGGWGITFDAYEVSFVGDENILELDNSEVSTL